MAKESRSACRNHTESLVIGMLSRTGAINVVSDRTQTCDYRLWVDRGDVCGKRSVVTATSRKV